MRPLLLSSLVLVMLLGVGLRSCFGQNVSAYQWKPWPGNQESALLLHGKQVGAWNALEGYYRTLFADGHWGPKEKSPPIAPPVAQFGVQTDKLSPSTSYCINGRPANRQAAVEAITRARIPDLQSKKRLTVIGAATETRPVLDDLAKNPLLTPFQQEVFASAYEPTHWHVSQGGFVTSGHPTIYIQDASGKVLHRQDDYAGGAQELAQVLGRLRKPRPDYDPSKDPRISKAPLKLPTTALLLGVVGVGAYLITRRKS